MLFRLLICWSFLAIASADACAEAPLFSSHELMEISIPLDFKSLCRPREDPNCDYAPTTLEYLDGMGMVGSIPIEVIIRGGWRALAKNCSAPLLFIRFDKNSTLGTPFEGQTLLPLTTHCGQGLSVEAAKVRQRRSTWEQYLLKEYLAHRLYNEITEVSLGARLVRISYLNPDRPGRKVINYAFFTEHFASVAERSGHELKDRGQFNPGDLDLQAADLLALFQFMIGNTDWSIARERNITLLYAPDGTQVPLPYDFDMSGLVNAQYAGPAPGLPIDEVTKRYYLGYCHPGLDWIALSEHYLSRKMALQSLVNETPGLDNKSTKSTQRFLQGFFDILQSPKLREEKIARTCQPLPPSYTNHTTPWD